MGRKAWSNARSDVQNAATPKPGRWCTVRWNPTPLAGSKANWGVPNDVGFAYGPSRFHNLTSGPSSPRTGSVFGSFTSGIVFNAFAWFCGVGRVICIGGPGG